MPTPEDMRGLVERFNQKVFNEHDIGACAEMLAEDVLVGRLVDRHRHDVQRLQARLDACRARAVVVSQFGPLCGELASAVPAPQAPLRRPSHRVLVATIVPAPAFKAAAAHRTTRAQLRSMVRGGRGRAPTGQSRRQAQRAPSHRQRMSPFASREARERMMSPVLCRVDAPP